MFALQGLGHNQFEFARWYEDKNHFQLIKVSVAGENEKRWDTVIQGLITTNDSTVLLTYYAYPYQKRQHLFYRGSWWEIKNVGERTMEVNPQTMGLVRPDLQKQSILEIIQVNGYDA